MSVMYVLPLLCLERELDCVNDASSRKESRLNQFRGWSVNWGKNITSSADHPSIYARRKIPFQMEPFRRRDIYHWG
jgi:hypothetical protein